MHLVGSYDDFDLQVMITEAPHHLNSNNLQGGDIHRTGADQNDPNEDEPNDDGFLSDAAARKGVQVGDKPYNEWLFECLTSAPNNEMQLHEIYEWFRENTPKGAHKKQTGWMNSVRHNLSMNEVSKNSESSALSFLANSALVGLRQRIRIQL